MALDFNGTTDVAQNLNGIAELDTNSWTHAAWVQTDLGGESDQGAIIAVQNTDTARTLLRLDNITPFTAAASDNGATDARALTTTTIAHDGTTWVLVIGTFDAATGHCAVYFGDLTNPVAAQTLSTDAVLVTKVLGSNRVTIGNNNATTQTYDGRVTRAGIWTRLLSLGEMELLRAGIVPLDGCARFYPCGDDGGSPTYDFMGFHLTITGTTTVSGPALPLIYQAPAPARARSLQPKLLRFPGRRFLSFPRPEGPPPPADVTVVAGASTALGITPQPNVLVDVSITPAIAAGSTPATTQLVTSAPTAALALGSTPAPVKLVTAFPAAALGLGSAPVPVVSVTAPVTAALALGSALAPAALINVAPTAALALGVTPGPAVLVVVPVGAATALGITPTATAIIAGGDTTVPVAAALAVGSTPQPTVLVTSSPAAALAAGSTPAATVLVVVPVDRKSVV